MTLRESETNSLGKKKMKLLIQ